jgi:hypothetical protein
LKGGLSYKEFKVRKAGYGMVTFYTVIFIVGILYTVVSFILNGISGAIHLGSHGGHMHLHTNGHGHVPAHLSDTNGHNVELGHDSGITNTFLTWLGVLINPLVAVSFLTVFGGLGILCTDHFKLMAPVTFLISLCSGIVISSAIYKFIAMPLYRSENSTEVSQADLTYTRAEVTSPIIENGFGKIAYTVNSIRYTAPAKHYKGKAVSQGEEVIIYKVEDHIFYIIEYMDLQNIDFN